MQAPSVDMTGLSDCPAPHLVLIKASGGFLRCMDRVTAARSETRPAVKATKLHCRYYSNRHDIRRYATLRSVTLPSALYSKWCWMINLVLPATDIISATVSISSWVGIKDLDNTQSCGSHARTISPYSPPYLLRDSPANSPDHSLDRGVLLF